MRAVKSVLVMAGSLKRANQGQDERDVLIRAMKDANVPKFLQQDLPLFLAIVQDLFPESVIVEPDYTEFLGQLEESLEAKGLQSYHKVFKQKVI
jgi:dynein heavy chain